MNTTAALQNTNPESEDAIEQMLDDVLGTSQVGYIDDLETLFGRHRQSIWRWYSKAKKFPPPGHIAGQRAWTRPVLREALREIFNSETKDR